jgi:hypothetical protein
METSYLAADEERNEGHSGLTFSGPSRVMIKVQPMITPSRTPSDAASKQASVSIKTTLPPNIAAEEPNPRLTLNLGVIRYIPPLDGRPPVLTSPRFDLRRPGRGHITQLIGDSGERRSEGGRRGLGEVDGNHTPGSLDTELEEEDARADCK